MSSPPNFESISFAADTSYIDVKMFGVPKFGAVYLIEDEKVAIVESGTSDSANRILAGLKDEGVEPSDVDYIFVTHIHLDHAGGAGFLLDRMTKARVVVHERGFKHLADPSRLLQSAREALGDYASYYGTLKPIPRENLVPVKGGEVFDLGNHKIEIIYSPGHARHHVCIWDRLTNCLFAGDAAGIYLPPDELCLPTTPAPEFDLEDSLETMRMLMTLNPRAILYTHFGPQEDSKRLLQNQMKEYKRWDSMLRERIRGSSLDEVAQRIEEEYSDMREYPGGFLLRTIRTNVVGFKAYYERIGRRHGV